MKTETTVTLNKPQLNRALLRVVLPIALQDLISSSLSLVDNMMIGRVGEMAMASVGAASQLFNILWGVLFGFSSACSAYMSQFWGTKDLPNIRRTIGFCAAMSCAIGALLCICSYWFPEKLVGLFTNIPEAIPDGAAYLRIIAPTFVLFPVSMTLTAGLRSTQQTLVPLYIGIATFFTNTLVNYICIFGKLGVPVMGVQGAAVGTLVARIVEITAVLTVIFIKRNCIAGPVKEFLGFGRELVRRVVQSGFPVMINESFWAIGISVINGCFGRLTAAEYSSYLAANTIQMMFMLVAFSMGDAVMILVGQKLGQGQLDLAYAMAKYFNNIGTLIGVIMSGLMALLAPVIVNLYHFSPENTAETVRVLYVNAIFMAVQLRGALTVIGALRCGGDTRFAMFCELGTLWLISIPAVILGVFVLKWPLYWIIALYSIGWIVKMLVAERRFRKRIWCRNLVHNL